MNADTIPDDPLARDILKALVDSRAGYNYYDDTRLLLPIIERHTADRIATLEARIEELTREREGIAALDVDCPNGHARKGVYCSGWVKYPAQEHFDVGFAVCPRRVRAAEDATRLAPAPEKETTP